MRWFQVKREVHILDVDDAGNSTTCGDHVSDEVYGAAPDAEEV
jgi:hypothetical protein